MRCSLTTLPKEHLSTARSAKKDWLSFHRSLALVAILSTVLRRVPIEKILQHLYHCRPKSPNRRCPRRRGKESRKYITRYILRKLYYKNLYAYAFFFLQYFFFEIYIKKTDLSTDFAGSTTHIYTSRHVQDLNQSLGVTGHNEIIIGG